MRLLGLLIFCILPKSLSRSAFVGTFFDTGAVVRGDVNVDRVVNIIDAILALKIVADLQLIDHDQIRMDADVDDNNNKIGVPEAVFCLQTVAELRD